MSFLDTIKKLLGGKKESTPAPDSPGEAQNQGVIGQEPTAQTPPSETSAS